MPAQDHVTDPEVESQSTDNTPTAEDVGSTTGTANPSKVNMDEKEPGKTGYDAALLNYSGAGAVTYPVPNLHVDVNKDSGAGFQMAPNRIRHSEKGTFVWLL